MQPDPRFAPRQSLPARGAWGRRLLYAWPLGAVGIALLGSGSASAAWLIAFTWIAALLPVALVIGRVFGVTAGTLAHSVSAFLVIAQVVLPAPALSVGPQGLTRAFASPDQMVRHRIGLPPGQTAWGALIAGGPEPEAYVYVAIAPQPGIPAPPLAVTLGSTRLGILTRTSLLPGVGDDETIMWHRLRVPGTVLRSHPDASPLEIVIAPETDGGFSPASVAVAGGFSFRPSVAEGASAFFDGSAWRTEESALFDGVPEGAGRLRYYIELRLVDSMTRRLLGTYY